MDTRVAILFHPENILQPGRLPDGTMVNEFIRTVLSFGAARFQTTNNLGIRHLVSYSEEDSAIDDLKSTFPSAKLFAFLRVAAEMGRASEIILDVNFTEAKEFTKTFKYLYSIISDVPLTIRAQVLASRSTDIMAYLTITDAQRPRTRRLFTTPSVVQEIFTAFYLATLNFTAYPKDLDGVGYCD